MWRNPWLPQARHRFVSAAVAPAAHLARWRPRLEQLEDRVVPSTINGQVFHDLNADGVKQSSEPGLSGWTLYLDSNNNGTLDSSETSTTTDASGNYSFANLDPATYTVREVVQAAWFQSKPGGPDFKYTVPLVSDQTVDGRDFGNYQQAEFRGVVFEDANANGTRDTGEPTQAGWTVYWDQNNDAQLNQYTTALVASDVPKTIADLTTVTSTLAVTGSTGRVADVNVTLNIAHTWDDDVSVFLLSPAGTRVELFSRVGSNGKNFTLTTLDDQAATAITAGTAPFTGSYRPKGALAALNGQNPNGTWSLEVSDTATGDTGTLLGWSLTLTSGEPSSATNANGAFALTGLTPGTYTIREVLPPGWVQSKPAGTDLKYAATLTSGQTVTDQDFGNYRPVEVRGAAFEDLNGNGAKDVGEPGTAGWMLYLDANTNGTLDQSVANVSSTDVPKTIPDPGTTTATVAVRKLTGRILDVNVTLSVLHSRASDVSAFLTSPAGTRIELFGHVGEGGKDFTNTTLDDQASTAITAGTAPFSDSYRPTGALAAVNGQDPNGTWTLQVGDDTPLETGTLQSWSLAISYATEPIALSNATGGFAFTNLTPGSYTVRQVPQPTWTQTRPSGPDFRYTLTLTSGQVAADRDFGNQRANANPTLIEGVNYDGDALNNSFPITPPDPSAAAGPNHLVSVVNRTIQWFTKAGTRESNQSLGAFFAPLTPVVLFANPYDPKVIYDPYAGRFVVLALELTETASGAPTNSSRILLAVSDDDNPNGTWFYQAIDSRIAINGINRWADRPGVVVDADALYVTANMLAFGTGSFGGARLWILDKAGLYAGGTGTVTLQDPGGAARLSSPVPFLQPAQMFGPRPGNVGTFFLTSGWYNPNNGNNLLSIIRLDNPLTTPTFSNQFVDLGHVDDLGVGVLLSAPQRGTTTGIETDPGNVTSAVWRNNTLWVSNTVIPLFGPDVGQPTVHWYQIDTTNLAALVVRDQGNVGGEDIAPGTYTFNPALTVNSAGTMGLGFSASAPTIFPGAYYTGRLSTDPAGTVRPSRTLAAGQDFFVRTGGGRNRWGDYSSIAVDPADNTTFWVYNEYALTQGSPDNQGETGRWGTRLGRFTITGNPGQAPPQQPDPGDDGPSENLDSSLGGAPVFRARLGPEWLLALDAIQGFVPGSKATRVSATAMPVNAGQGESGSDSVSWRLASPARLLEKDGPSEDRGNLRGHEPEAASASWSRAALDQAFRDFTGTWMEDTGLEERSLR